MFEVRRPRNGSERTLGAAGYSTPYRTQLSVNVVTLRSAALLDVATTEKSHAATRHDCDIFRVP